MTVFDFWHCEICGCGGQRGINQNFGGSRVCPACRKLTPVQRSTLRRKRVARENAAHWRKQRVQAL